MGLNHYSSIIFGCLICVLSASCERKAGDLLRSELTKPKPSRLETMTDPYDAAEEAKDNPPPDATNQSGKNPGSTGSAMQMSNDLTSMTDFLPTWPFPYDSWPPVPMDDDYYWLYDDDDIEYVYAVCGDGTLSRWEGCDDGNVNSGDGCSRKCQIEYQRR